MAAGLVAAIRRALLALAAGAVAALAIRLRGKARTPAQTGGWRVLRDDELA